MSAGAREADIRELDAPVDAYRRFAMGLPLAPSNAIFELCDALEAALDALDRVRCDAEEVLEYDAGGDPWFQGARTVARDVLDAIAGPQPEDDR